MQPPKLSDKHALFLDFDGTLIELADSPEAILVPKDLAARLTNAQTHLGGALAVVSGREIHNLRHHLPAFLGPFSGSHGMEMSGADGNIVGGSAELAQTALEISQSLRPFVGSTSGLLLEEKQFSVSLHYRGNPGAELECRTVMEAAAKPLPDWTLLHGKCVFELRPSNVSKHSAVSSFMKSNPFSGRIPVFVGDDKTDEDGMKAVIELGGFGVKVGTGDSVAEFRLDNPSEVLRYISDI